MPTVVLKLFAGHGTGQTDKASPFGEYKNVKITTVTL